MEELAVVTLNNEPLEETWTEIDVSLFRNCKFLKYESPENMCSHGNIAEIDWVGECNSGKMF